MRKNLLCFAFLLISTGVSPQNIFRTACQGNLVRLDSLLLVTELDIRDDRGRNLAHWAVACRKKEVLDYLIEKGIDTYAEDVEKKIPLHVAVQYGNREYFDLLRGLQPYTNWKEKYGTSLLEAAILNRDLSFVELLTDLGVDPNGTNARGSTALEISKRIGAKNIADHILSRGADPNLVRTIILEGAYMGLSRTGKQPKMLAPNFISTEEQQFGSVFNAAGTEFYYGVVVNGKNEIRYSEMVGNSWSLPVTLLAHDRYGYNDPILSPDERRLYFISDRALDGEGELKDIDIWYVEINEDGWTTGGRRPNCRSRRC